MLLVVCLIYEIKKGEKFYWEKSRLSPVKNVKLYLDLLNKLNSRETLMQFLKDPFERSFKSKRTLIIIIDDPPSF